MYFANTIVAASSAVWANAKSHVYHCEEERWYGKIKSGRFMTQSAAIQIGGRPAGGKRCN